MKTFFTSAATLFAPRVVSKSGAALGALLLGGVIFAGPVAAQQPVVIDKTDAATFRVRTQNPLKERVQVQVVSGNTGQRLFAEAYDQSYYSRRFNFQNLKPGAYFLVARIGQDTYRYTIQVKPTATGQAVAVRNVKVRLGNRSQQMAALNTLTPVASTSALANNGSGL